MQVGAKYLGNNQCEFTVWGPNLDFAAVQLVSQNGRLVPMEQQNDGYWQAIASEVQPGTQYFYQLNGGECRPDPASHFQPKGVHGPSQVIDHQFDWTDQTWEGVPLESLIIYELHVGTFTPEGTFAAIIPRLKDLRELGITAIELMPVAQFSGSHPPQEQGQGNDYRNWGYDGTYLYGVQNSYGEPASLKQLVDACHQEGISVILDVVYNHFGPEGSYVQQYGPYYTQAYQTLWGSALNFDQQHSSEVRNFFIQNALYWMQTYHIDALRLDAVHAIYDLGAYHILEEIADHVAALSTELGRKLFLIAESDLNDTKIICSSDNGGYGLDAQWSDDFHHSLHALLTGDRIGYYQDFGQCQQLAKAFQQAFVYDWQYAPHRRRFHGRTPKSCSPTQFVVSIQNHDQIGNQLKGDRLPQVISFEALKLAAGAVLLSPFIPMLFMGEEYAEEAPFTYFVSHSDPELIRAVRQGRKQEFEAFHYDGEPPDPEAVDTFVMCKLNWDKRKEGKHQVLWSFYQHLIRLRNTLPSLLHYDFQSIQVGSDEDKQIVWWRRWHGDNQVFCLMNFNSATVTFDPTVDSFSGHKILDSALEKWMGSGSPAPEAWHSGQSVTLSPQSLALYQS